MFYTLLSLGWKGHIDDIFSVFSLWNVDKKEIEEFIVLANSHHPTQLNLRLKISQTKNKQPGYHSFQRGKIWTTSKQSLISAHILSPCTRTFQFTHFSSCHPPGVRKKVYQRRSPTSSWNKLFSEIFRWEYHPIQKTSPCERLPQQF